jgi:phosphoenolpyruvate synthase/pyruvate phosphate dikinase
VPKKRYVRWFESSKLDDISEVGGKNAPLGELYSVFATEGIRVPDGFAFQIDAIAQLFDGFSIGSNDLTQLTLASIAIRTLSFDFDERGLGMLEMLRLAVTGTKRNHRHVRICGEAPANYLEIARFLTGLGIDPISVNAASLLRTMTVVHEAEQALADPLAAE